MKYVSERVGQFQLGTDLSLYKLKVLKVLNLIVSDVSITIRGDWPYVIVYVSTDNSDLLATIKEVVCTGEE